MSELIFTANTTHDYGNGIHQCLFVYESDVNINIQYLSNIYDHVYIEKDYVNISKEQSGFYTDLVFDTNLNPPRIRVKREDEFLKDLKTYKKNNLKIAYENMLLNGCSTNLNNIKMDCNSISITNLMTTYHIVTNDLNINIIEVQDYYNNRHNLNRTEFFDLYNYVLNYYNELLKNKWNLEKSVDEATTKIQIENISW